MENKNESICVNCTERKDCPSPHKRTIKQCDNFTALLDAKSISDEARKRVEDNFEQRMKNENVKPGSKTYMKLQFYYFCGAMDGFGVMDPFWSICLSAGREIISTRNSMNKE